MLFRSLCGVGVSACLMAPLTGYRRWFDPTTQLRTNSWMLMTGSLGMVAATLPVQWLLPIWGWRALFVAMAVCIGVSMLSIRLLVPDWQRSQPGAQAHDDDGGYSAVWRSRYFWRMTPIGFFSYGGMVAIQTLWAGPWMTQVAGWTPLESATGLFAINLSMLTSFWLWGWITPGLARRGIHADGLIAKGFPLSLLVLTALVLVGPGAGAGAAALLAAFCVCSTFVSLAQPAVGMAFSSHLAGRALSAYNLVIFVGVFVVQWGIGLLIDGFQALGLGEVTSFRAALAVLLACCIASWANFMRAKPDNPLQ